MNAENANSSTVRFLTLVLFKCSGSPTHIQIYIAEIPEGAVQKPRDINKCLVELYEILKFMNRHKAKV